MGLQGGHNLSILSGVVTQTLWGVGRMTFGVIWVSAYPTKFI